MKANIKKVPKALGDTIQKQRKQRNFSQESFAYHCGLHRTYMGAVERGERNVSLRNIVKIANGLDLKVSELFDLAGV